MFGTFFYENISHFLIIFVNDTLFYELFASFFKKYKKKFKKSIKFTKNFNFIDSSAPYMKVFETFLQVYVINT